MEYYNHDLKDIYNNFNTSKEGLTKVKAQSRIDKYGYNEIKTKSNINIFSILINQFNDFLIYMLVFAAGFSFVIGEHIDSIIILVILIVNAIIGFFQEYNAQKSLEALKKLTLIEANVLRNGKMIRIDSKYLVPGDIIYLEAGDRIPADARIIEATRLKVEEASLTGESVPVDKDNNTIKGKHQIGDQTNMLFSSTTVVEGSARAIVTKSAMDTEIGKITGLIKEVKEGMTPLQRRLDKFGKKLGMIIIGICVIVFATLFTRELMNNGFTSTAFVEFILIAISLAVAAVPTAFPAVVTVALSRGVKRLLSKKCLVKKLASVETLGSCDVICTDKTGTLTKNEMTVKKIWTSGKEAEVSGTGYSPEGKITKKLNDIIYKIGYLCNNATVYEEEKQWKITGDPTEAALVISSRKAGFNEEELNKENKRIDELPFDSSRKMMSVLVKNTKTSKKTIYTKGAPDKVLDHCTYMLKNNKKVKLTLSMKKKILDKNKQYASDALRVLGFAYKDVSSTTKKISKEDDLVFAGMQAMIDPPREDVMESIRKTADAGIRVIMITGDHKITAKAIASEVGITGDVLTGDDVESMDDKKLTSELEKGVNIFARVIPEHKQRIINCLQGLNYTVAMTGDGVNDAPALKKANIGVAVGSGTEVAKEASDFVLLDDSFSHIVNAVEEGRGIYDNIQKSIMLLLSGNIGEVLIVFTAALLGFNLVLPAILLLWINLITDGAPALAYSVDPYGKKIMKRKPRPYNEGILPKNKMILISSLGIVGSAIALVMFWLNDGNSHIEQSMIIAQTMVFNFVVVYELILTFLIRKDYKVPFFSNPWLWAAVLFSLLMQGILMYIPPLRKIFEIAALDLSHVGMVFLAGMIFYGIAMIYYFVVHMKVKKDTI